MAAASTIFRYGRHFCEKQIYKGFNSLRNQGFSCQRYKSVRYKSWKTGESNGVDLEELVITTGRTRLIVRPLLFTVVAGVGTFAGCAILQYERMRDKYVTGSQNQKSYRFPKLFGFRDEALPDGSKTAAGIIFVNTLVFLMWRVPTIQIHMWRWFVSHPILAPPITLLTSCFSHMDFWHLAINMYVLWSFAPTIEALLGKEQFLAFYLSGGIFASFASQAFRIMTKLPIRASLGASGALFAVLSLVCITLPDTQLALVFLPWFSFSAGKALIGVVALDVAGLIFRWSMFDHAAHLGGVLFGAFYLKYGHHYLWDKRGWLMQQWHRLRRSVKKSPP
ncbi:Presenilins-associated rhomboid-like protein, mitochondrial [Exaiptasia diaphana]|nr:Presenilins-associated rhomboid-like protein, mitochondrial [Exaiptasia diaphana]